MGSPARLAAAIACLICSTAQAQAQVEEVATRQERSQLGATEQWPLDPALSRSEIQLMRDRAYGFCMVEKASDEGCIDEQDHSLFHYVSSFALVRLFRAERRPTNPFAAGHIDDPSAFDGMQSYCYSIYSDHGARDARMLGPCMMARLGGDFFGVVSVP